MSEFKQRKRERLRVLRKKEREIVYVWTLKTRNGKKDWNVHIL